jgi:hypothetical protein
MEAFIFCCPLLLLLLLIVGIVWLVRRSSGPAAPPPPPAPIWSDAIFDAQLGRTLDGWVAQGRMPHEIASQILVLLREDRSQQTQPVAASAVAPQPPIAIAPPVATSPPAADAPPAIPERPLGERLWESLLALRTRQTLLFLGAFLLVVSALILVVFNWASFPPLLQFGLLAAVCGGLWGGGYWLSARWGLTGAGIGLRAIAAALTPVVAFSLSRPGLLDLTPRGGWLLASLLSLPIYALAAWRLRHVSYVVAGCLAAASTVLAALSFAGDQWLPAALVLVLAGYLPLARVLRRTAPTLAAGPSWVAYSGLPVALLWAVLWVTSGQIGYGALATTLFAAAGFAVLAAWLERRPLWGWAAAALAPLGLLATLAAWSAGPVWWALVPGVLALAALGLGTLLERRMQAYAPPAYACAAGLALLALAFTQDWGTARWALPVLIAVSISALVAAHRGRLAWLGPTGRLAAATLALALTGALLPAWALALLDLTALSDGQRGLALLPLAALAFAAARFWPGRLRQPYDLTLQALGALLALGAGSLALLDETTAAVGMAALAAIWAFQTILRRRSLWAALALGSALLAAVIELALLDIDVPPIYWYGLALLFSALYTVGGTLLRRSAWRCLTWPGLLWGALAGATALLGVAVEIIDGDVLARHVAVVGVLAALLALTAALWRRAWLGYLVALLLALAVLLAAKLGFFLPWQPAPGDFGYVICGLALGLALLGQGLRWALADRRRRTNDKRPTTIGTENQEPGTNQQNTELLNSQFSILNAARWYPHGAARYAIPYEVVGFALLTFAPLAAIADPQHACLTWLAMALLYALAAWLYRLPWAIAPALVAADLALLHGAAWLGPGVRAADAARLLLAAAWAQGLLGLWARRTDDRRPLRPSSGQATTNHQPLTEVFNSQFAIRNSDGLREQLSTPAYLVALLSGLGALLLASGASDALALNALGLAALAALLGSAERHEALAWSALGLLALGLGALHDVLGVTPLWSAAWGVAESLIICLFGWMIEWRMKNEELRNLNEKTGLFILHSRFSIWQRPLWLGPLLSGVVLAGVLVLVAPLRGELPPLTFALATLALLLATLTARRRTVEYGYAAGAVLIAAGLCQLYNWGFRQPQWYVLPAGLYLLALSEGLRRFQGRRGLAQMLETGAAVLMLGTTLGQSLQSDGLLSQGYAAWLCVQSLLLLGYGALRQRRSPFFGGVAFFVFGVAWLSVDPLLAANKWMLLGALGLLLVGAYVLLERRQEQLARLGRAIVERISGWS